jgi:hypothetical protein
MVTDRGTRAGALGAEVILREGAMPSNRRLGTALICVAAAELIATAGMAGFIAAAAPKSRLAAQLAEHGSVGMLYRLGFVSASLLSLAFLTMLVLLLAARGREAMRLRDWLAILFLPMYATCSIIAYMSQYVVLPVLIERDPSGAGAWYFQDERSIPVALDLLGYAFVAIALGLFAIGFHQHEGIWRWIGEVMLLVAATSFAAFIVLAAGARSAAGLVSITSAVLMMPLAGLAIALGLQLRHPPRPKPVIRLC